MSRKLNRRQFLKGSAVLAGAAAVPVVGVAMPHEVDLPDPYPVLQPSKPAVPPFNPDARFFNRHQYALVATIAALIIPSDDGPGATEAGVVDYIDNRLAESPDRQKIYSRGLQWIDAVSRDVHGAANDFLSLTTAEQVALLRTIDRSNLIHRRHGDTFFQKVDIKLGTYWDMIFGLGRQSKFFYHIRRDALDGFYSNPVSWEDFGFFGPPQPEGYPDFMDPPTDDNYTGMVRNIRSATCKKCHQDVEHPVGELIDHSCKRCHHPHKPWPVDESAVHLEDHAGFLFPSPDRDLKEG